MNTESNPGGDHIADATAVLYSSYLEIVALFESLARERTTIEADLEGGELLFVSRVLDVDLEGRHFSCSYGTDQHANSVLLAQRSVRFVTFHQGARLEFRTGSPVETVFEACAALRFGIPKALVRSQRRDHPRLPAPKEVSIRCVAEAGGVMPFEAKIVDISLGGMGALVSNADIRLTPGTVLKGCRIVIPAGAAIQVDLEVRYTRTVIQPDGTLANRSGVRFVQRPPEVDQLIDVFVRNLDKTKTP